MTDVMKYQIVSAVFFQIILCLIIIHGVYRYFGKRKLCGETHRKVHSSRMRAMIHTTIFLVIAAVCVFCIWKMFRMGMDTIYTDYLYLTVLVIEFMIALWMDLIPQRFCENGILGYRGFTPWSAMQGIVDSKKKSVILIKVHERISYREEIACRPEEKEELERLIMEKIEEHSQPEAVVPEY